MEISRNLLAHYFRGECNADEKECIRQWMEESEIHRNEFVRERIRFDASLMVDEDEITAPRVHINGRIWQILKVAAMFLLLIGSGYFFSTLRTYNNQKTSMLRIHAPAGNRTFVTLPDGSTVWLNSNTSIEYPDVFSKEKRVVKLDGEAYFDITRNEHKPFIVNTLKYQIEVLGTEFNVEAYDNKPSFSTSLYEGKVKIFQNNGNADTVFLTKGEMAELDRGNLKIIAAEKDMARWRDGLIIIRDKSFEEIMALFEKYFDHHIIIQNKKVKSLGYNGKFRIADGVDHALHVLQYDFNFKYRRNEDTKTINIY